MSLYEKDQVSASQSKERLYFECTSGEDTSTPGKIVRGCQRVYCDLCQRQNVEAFEKRPHLIIQKIAIEKALTRIYRKIDNKFEESKSDCHESFALMPMSDLESLKGDDKVEK